MRLYFALTIFLTSFVAMAQGDLSANLKSQGQTTKLTVGTIEIPNNLATKTGSISALIENGNKNILSNPGFEHQTYNTNWTVSGCTPAKETSVVVNGKNSMVCVASGSSAISIKNTSTLYATEFARGTGIQGSGSLMVYTPSGVTNAYLCPVKAGTSISSNFDSQCYKIRNPGQWEAATIPFILGATSNGVELLTNGNAPAGNYYLDDGFSGPVSFRQDGSLLINYGNVGTTVISAVTTAPTKGTTTLDRVMAVRVGNRLIADIQYTQSATGTAGSGDYLFTLPVINGVQTTFDANVINFCSGTKYGTGFGPASCYVGNGSVMISGTSKNSIAASLYAYDSTHFRVMFLQTASDGGAGLSTYTISSLQMGVAETASLSYSFHVDAPITGWGSSTSSYQSTNADTDWAACNFSTLAMSGMGTITNNLQCRRSGSLLKMKGAFTFGTVTTSAAQLLLPTWNGTQLVSSSSIPALQVVGNYFRSSANVSVMVTSLTNASRNYLSMSNYVVSATAANPMTEVSNTSSVFGTGDTWNINGELSIPIDGWQNSNVIIGSFVNTLTAPGVTSPKHYSFKFSNAANSHTVCSTTCVVWNEVGSGLITVTRTSTGNYDINFPSGTWTGAATYNCSKDVLDWSGGTGTASAYDSAVQTATKKAVRVANSTTVDASMEVLCTGY